jgi:hypothetical protein
MPWQCGQRSSASAGLTGASQRLKKLMIAVMPASQATKGQKELTQTQQPMTAAWPPK